MTEQNDSLRSRNMRKRRERILAEARGMITQAGLESFNLRDLAKAAGVTVPTIYNLIGSKEEVMVAIFADILSLLESRIDAERSDQPLALAEAIVNQTAELFATDEPYYRAAFLAVEHVHRMQSRPQSVTLLYNWGAQMQGVGIAACANAGLLRGRIAHRALAGLVKRSFQENLHSWVFGEIPLARFRAESLADLYIILSADAVDTFAAVLARKIEAVTTTQARENAEPVTAAGE
ncbi:TetR/AcrR family transcriptional regulator [Pseudomonas sp. H11T01]|uniref:TetR/AcrR family transcriptional regulator n=1 Tax=Pseudomonas sp. H11T01 TaxID=3402749 RepID=UPI003AD2CB80